MAKVDYENIEATLESIGDEMVIRMTTKLEDNRDTGALIKSVKYTIKDLKLSLSFLNYGEALDTGTRPHMPPVDKIKGWANRKGIKPWALAISIKKKGTKAHPWLYIYDDIIDENKDRLSKAFGKDIEDDMDDIIEKINK